MPGSCQRRHGQASGERRRTAGVMLSNYGAIAMCLANRHQGVRAILASDESRTATDAVSVGANLLVWWNRDAHGTRGDAKDGRGVLSAGAGRVPARTVGSVE